MNSKKRSFSRPLVSIFLILLTVCLSSCTSEPPSSSVGEMTDGQITGEQITQQPLPEPSADDLRGGRLIYSEDFDSYGTTAKSALDRIGWRALACTDGAVKSASAACSVEAYGDGYALKIKNNEPEATDSYFLILDDAQMGFFAEESYTLQYDVEYTGAVDASRYFSVICDWGSTGYDTFFVRNGGKGQNQSRIFDVWHSWDVSDGVYCSFTDTRALSNTLLSIPYSSKRSSFDGVSFSVRVVRDVERGYSAYVRINDEGYPGSDKWTLVSEASERSGAFPFLNSEYGSSALVLKVGGRQDGYIDNLLVWEGVGEMPEGEQTPLLRSGEHVCFDHEMTSELGCTSICKYCGYSEVAHELVEVPNASDSVCRHCKTLESNQNGSWQLDRVPRYDGGKCSENVYLCGQGIGDPQHDRSGESKMLVVSSTTQGEFDAYLKKLESYGYVRTFFKRSERCTFAQYELEGRSVYTYFSSGTKEARIIDDTPASVTPDDFGYLYTPKENDTTVLYQFGLPMNSKGVDIDSSGEGMINNGMMYILKLADNSVIIIDGGSYKQFDSSQISSLMSFLLKITNTPSIEKVRISAWYITHMHIDHLSGMMTFLKKYEKRVTVERLMYNSVSAYTDNYTLAYNRPLYLKFLYYVRELECFSDVKEIKLHTGQTLNIANAKIDVLYTHEDQVGATGVSLVETDFNNTCTVAKISFDGKSFLVLGDIHKPSMNVMFKNYTYAELKCDILQVAHHGFNNLNALYEQLAAPAVLFPQSLEAAQKNATAKKVLEIVRAYADPNLVFFASEGTYSIRVEGGVLTGGREAAVAGGKYTGWSW